MSSSHNSFQQQVIHPNDLRSGNTVNTCSGTTLVHATVGVNTASVPTSSTPSSGAASSVNSDFQVYRNLQEGYSILIPAVWTVSTSDVGTAYFLSPEGVNLRKNGLTDWEASIAGIQIVGRTERLDENAQYESILPNHCVVVNWNVIEVDSITGRRYNLDCDNAVSAGIHREEHVYIPQRNRFAELWLKIESTMSEMSIPSLDKLLFGLHLEYPQQK